MAAKHNLFAASPFNTFIPYAPPEPRAARRPAVKQTRVRGDDWTDIDELIRNLGKEGDSLLDTLAATPPLNPFDPGSSWFNSVSLALFLTKVTR